MRYFFDYMTTIYSTIDTYCEMVDDSGQFRNCYRVDIKHGCYLQFELKLKC